MKIRTPNTNISEQSITTFFLKDGAVTTTKISKTGALDNQVLTYDSTTDTVIWKDTPSASGDVEVNPDSFDPSGWTQFGGFDFWGSSPLRSSKSAGAAFSIARKNSDNGFGFMESLVLERDYDFSGDTINNDIMATNTNFIATPGGGARRTSSTWTRLRDITVAGTDGTDCEYDEYDAHFELVTYNKASGSNEVSYSVVDASSDRTQIMNKLEVVARQPDSGNVDLSGLQLRYVGPEQGEPDAYLTLYQQDFDVSVDMVRFRNDAGTAKTEFKTNAYFEQDVSISGQITASTDSRHRIGDLQIDRNTISLATEDEVEFDADFNVTGTSYFGSGSGTGISSTGEISTFGSATKVPFGETIQLKSKASDPTGITGGVYFNSTSNKFRGYNGTAWLDLDSQGSELQEATFSGKLNLVEDSASSEDLSKIYLEYTGASTGVPKAELKLYNKDEPETNIAVRYYGTGVVATNDILVVGQNETGSNNFSITNTNGVATFGKASLSSSGGVSTSIKLTIDDTTMTNGVPVKWATISSLTNTAYHIDGLVGLHPTSGYPIYYNSGWKYFVNNLAV